MTLPDRIALDTNCFIYFFADVETDRARFLADEIFGPLGEGRRTALTSTITVAELLARPYRDGNPAAARSLLAALEAVAGLDIVVVDTAVADTAARVRGADEAGGLRPPDAIQLAAAVAGSAEALLTNDVRLRRDAAPLPVLIIDELIAQQA